MSKSKIPLPITERQTKAERLVLQSLRHAEDAEVVESGHVWSTSAFDSWNQLLVDLQAQNSEFGATNNFSPPQYHLDLYLQ